VAGAVSASIALHVAFAVLLAIAPAVLPPSDVLSPAAEIAIEIRADEEIEPPVVEEDREVVATPPPEERTAEPVRRERGAVISMPDRAVTISPETTIRLPETETTEPPPITEEERQRQWLLIDPTAAARSVVSFDGEGPSQRRGPQAAIQEEAPDEEAIEAMHRDHLRAEAMAKRHVTHTPIVPQRQRDGSYVWRGAPFTATIHPDGEVEFADRPMVQTEGFSASGSFDLTDMLMGAAGQDPLAAERERFMEETAELRERLEAAHRRQSMASAIDRIPAEMELIWGRRRPAVRRRREIFDWYDTTDDVEGARARAAILRWVQAHVPEDSPDAFDREELERWNSARTGAHEFWPYGE
jgi:hypothetical protein